MTAGAEGGTAEPAFARWLRARLGCYAGRRVPLDEPLAEWGLGSVALLGFHGDIEERFGRVLDPSDLWAHPTLRELAAHLARTTPAAPRPGKTAVAFVFPGQSGGHPATTAGLYREWTAYRRRLAQADAALIPHLGRSVTELVCAGGDRVRRAPFPRPASFAVEFALATALVDGGVRPVAVLGHGVGEYAAAVLAGALSLGDAARLVCLHERGTRHLPPGGAMLACSASPPQAAVAIAGEPGVYVAAVNAARATVLSGARPGLERVRARLTAAGTASRFLPLAHAFQSPLMEPAARVLEAAARRLPPGTPRIRFYSTVHGRPFEGPLDAAYWTRHLTSPVLFADAVRALSAQQAPSHVVEIASCPVLTPFVRRVSRGDGPVCTPIRTRTATSRPAEALFEH